MAHLGRDVAGFVDGQLAPKEQAAAVAHLLDCARCRAAVNEQRRLKVQMSTARLPEPPADLQAALRAFVAAPPRYQRGVPRVAVAGLTVAGTTLLVLAIACFAGGRSLDGDLVTPTGDALLAAFAASAAPATTAAPETMRAHGWACPARLGTLRRQGVAVTSDAVVVAYASRAHRLQLHEQYGVVDESALAAAEVEKVGDAKVWVVSRSPAVVIWQAPNAVLTLVTDLDQAGWRQVVRQLPAVSSPGTTARVGTGLERLASLLS